MSGSKNLAALRACADGLLAQDAEEPSPGEAEKSLFRLRALLVAIVPEAELAALELPDDSAQRACALHCVGDARMRIRSVRVLCDHYENGDHQCPKGPERAAYVRLRGVSPCSA